MKKDVYDYLEMVSNQYNKMLELAYIAEKEYKTDKMTKKMFDNFVNKLMVVKNNYSRIAYIIYLLEKPKKEKKQKIKTKDLYSMLNADTNAISNENENALNDMQGMLPKQEEKKDE